MTKASAPNLPVVTRFVREVLGCQCPDEVFRAVEVQPGSSAVSSCPADYELRIGGRLLVVVTSTSALLQSPAGLAPVIAEGQRARDALGFNRFRLVLQSADPARDQHPLLRAFKSLSGRDEKTHLHVLKRGDVPDFFAP